MVAVNNVTGPTVRAGGTSSSPVDLEEEDAARPPVRWRYVVRWKMRVEHAIEEVPPAASGHGRPKTPDFFRAISLFGCVLVFMPKCRPCLVLENFYKVLL